MLQQHVGFCNKFPVGDFPKKWIFFWGSRVKHGGVEFISLHRSEHFIDFNGTGSFYMVLKKTNRKMKI